VDNHSTDTTRETAGRVTPLVLMGVLSAVPNATQALVLRAGPTLFFIDSDMVLANTVIEQCAKLITEDTAVKGIIIPERSVGEGFWARCKALERSCYVGDDTIEAARFFDRGAFEKVDGYDEALTVAEDWKLSQRARGMGSIRRVNAYITHCEGHLTLRKTMRSKFYYGTTLGRYIRKQPAAATHQLRLVRPAFVRHWCQLLTCPVLTVGMMIMKGCEFAAGGAGLALAMGQERGISRPA